MARLPAHNLRHMFSSMHEREVTVPLGDAEVVGTLNLPPQSRGMVVFAHGSGSSRHSTRNQFVAHQLGARGFSTFLLDLLTADEEREDRRTSAHRFNIELLGQRVIAAVDWLAGQHGLSGGKIGCFGASTGAAAALLAAAARPHLVAAVVSRGGRPDLAGGPVLDKVQAPTLLIVGGRDDVVIRLNQDALAQLRCPKQLEIVPGATHLFEEPGTLEQVAALAGAWFERATGPHADEPYSSAKP
jgi:putative phosphoribosyl transferase